MSNGRWSPGDIVIADERGGVALGGVMGGASSEVSAGTRRVLLEAATFDPISIRRTSKRLGLISEASYRFERGVDAEGVPRAAARAADLLAQLGGGAVLDAVVDRFPQPVAPRTARLPMARLQRLSGLPISAEEAAGELRKISDQVKVEGTGASAALALQVPSYRPDLALPEDLVEEILRLGGRYEAPRSNGCWPTPARCPAPTRVTTPGICWPAPACRRWSAGASCPGPAWRPCIPPWPTG